ncbi:Cytochrome c-type protein TorC [Thiorhodovibrio winogradskyi]|uniref:Cytochrome c-type protein TorC n=1 Tax=Thiorhodovibrio winogradskyi TaxID=77007 RepID=A0ABZ0SFR1_9GAMM|nr:NapC/NirT family cytochrome c [Thiorhodovibrio winogradskyi]
MFRFLSRLLSSRLGLSLLLLIVLVPAVMAMSWVGTETVIQQTSDAPFCTSCHSMTPFAETHAKDVHGGNNAGGVVAQCTDCHLPHDSPRNYLVAKVQTGLHDAMTQGISWLDPVDWIGNLEDRGDFVYDSGCLRCHGALKQATQGDEAALAAHKAYFAEEQPDQCVSCHTQVGHQDLRAAIEEHFRHLPTSDDSDDNAKPTTDEAADGAPKPFSAASATGT